MVGAWVLEIHSQKSREKSEELVVERSLKLDALNQLVGSHRWTPVIWTIQTEYPFKAHKKKLKKKCVLFLLILVSLLNVKKR